MVGASIRRLSSSCKLSSTRQWLTLAALTSSYAISCVPSRRESAFFELDRVAPVVASCGLLEACPVPLREVYHESVPDPAP